MKKILFGLIVLFAIPTSYVDAQYFGRNKPRYRSFDFSVKETPNFDIYHYFDDDDVINRLGQWTEQWYDLHQEVLKDTFTDPNPLIFYNNHAEFQQTNSISGGIGVGTGGVTEGLKNRVVMPVTYTNEATYQVLGHELVHAFQFHMIKEGDSTSLKSLQNLPLWIVEGMAEYMTLGRVDPFTAMWMRDAVLNDDVPSFKEMYSGKYFPYRYGQAAWSYLTGTYGDDVMEPIFTNTAIYGLETAIPIVLGESMDTVSQRWQSSLKSYFKPFIDSKVRRPIGKKLLSEENSGKLNVSPSLSPNGRYVVFLSEKDLFSTDLFIAEARSGKVIGKVASLVKDTELDNLNVIESAGTWSPDSKRFAFIGFQKGRNVIVIKDPLTGKTLETKVVDDVPAMVNPTWSPDGKKIVFTGLVGGHTDLYSLTLKSGRVEQLTDDPYSEIQADFSKDGSKLVFAYDKRSMTGGRTHGKFKLDLAEMDLATKSIKILSVFTGANNFNPMYDHEDNIYFISEREGYRNLFRLMSTGEVFQMTDLITGITGISRFSPAIAVAKDRDRVLYTHYDNRMHSIYQSSAEKLLNKEVEPVNISVAAGTLPVVGGRKTDIVNKNLFNLDNLEYVASSEFKDSKYRPNFQLDYVGGGTGVGVSNSTFGTYTGLQGGIDLLFGDMIGNHQLFSQVALNGELYDLGGRATYINRTHRLAWGVGYSHIPNRTGYQEFSQDIVEDGSGQTFNALITSLNLIRIFDKSFNGFAHYPFSTTLRLEGGISGSHRGFRWDKYDDIYVATNVGYQQVGSERNRQEVGDQLEFNQYYTLERGFGANANVALVGDNSFFGMTGPIMGQRFRLSLERNFGYNDFIGALADYRKYIYAKPFTIGFRGMAYGRFLEDVSSIYPIWLGQMGFVRGYNFVLDNNINNDIGSLDIGQLLGSKMAMFNAEVRLPFTGPKQIALLGSKFLFSDLILFFDSGIVIDEFSHLSDGEELAVLTRDSNGDPVLDANNNPIYSNQFIKPPFVMSAGVSTRVNLFGMMIVEPYLAWPIQKNTSMQFGFNLVPGW